MCSLSARPKDSTFQEKDLLFSFQWMFSFQCLSLNGSKLEKARVEKSYSLSFHPLICTCPVKHITFRSIKTTLACSNLWKRKMRSTVQAKIWKCHRVKKVLRIALERWYCWQCELLTLPSEGGPENSRAYRGFKKQLIPIASSKRGRRQVWEGTLPVDGKDETTASFSYIS